MSLTVLSHISLSILDKARQAHPDLDWIHVPEKGSLPPEARGEVLLTQTWGAPNSADVMQRGVRWVHTFGTGVNRYPFDTLGEARLTCSRGASAVPISEWTLAMMLLFAKRLPDEFVSEPPERWNVTEMLGGLHGARLAILGFGGIGQAIAQRALAFGMEVVACRRTRAPSPIDAVRVVETAAEAVVDADHVVVAAPATPETRHLVNADLLARMKPGVHLVNIARGSLVDQDALQAALESGHVARASLDTVSPEPLPAGHWLYTHPQVRLSPHISWSGPAAFDGLIDPFIENLRRYQAGEPLIHQVDVELGY